MPFDALDRSAHGDLVTTVFARGDIDVVLVAFGLLGDQTAIDSGDDVEAIAVTETNYLGAVSVGLPVARSLRLQGHGRLVVLSSVAGERARRSNFVYGSSKAGFDSFFQGLADWLAGTGVEVLVVRPGFVHSRMTKGMRPAPLATTPDAVAEAVAQGLAGRRHTVWAPPALRWVMAVLRLVPRPLFRRLPI